MASGRERRRLMKELSDAYQVSSSWLRALRRRAERGTERRVVGRPRIGDEERERVRRLVAQELEAQGFTTGWRPIAASIRGRESGPEKTSIMLMQEAASALKEEARARKRKAIEAAREGHEVLARDAVWAEDSTHLGRLSDREEVSGEVGWDRATTTTVILGVGPALTGESLIEHLERARAERGALPLVWQSDNGPANTCAWVAAWLESNQVIHLRSRVHTPTDNPAAEHANRELKAESGLGKGVVLQSYDDAWTRIAPVRRRLDEKRLRASRGYRTAAQLDCEMPRAETLVDRARFYEEARSAMRDAVLGLSDPREIRKTEQDAVWRTLERHGLARRRTGVTRTPSPTGAAETPCEVGYNAASAQA
jgi:hypothetical protein